MRVIDLDSGETLSAANDEELFNAVRGAVPAEQMSDDEVRQLIADRAYEASDS
jgi:hypothetical protein